jgi:hypothetical protein
MSHIIISIVMVTLLLDRARSVVSVQQRVDELHLHFL